VVKKRSRRCAGLKFRARNSGPSSPTTSNDAPAGRRLGWQVFGRKRRSGRPVRSAGMACMLGAFWQQVSVHLLQMTEKIPVYIPGYRRNSCFFYNPFRRIRGRRERRRPASGAGPCDPPVFVSSGGNRPHGGTLASPPRTGLQKLAKQIGGAFQRAAGSASARDGRAHSGF